LTKPKAILRLDENPVFHIQQEGLMNKWMMETKYG